MHTLGLYMSAHIVNTDWQQLLDAPPLLVVFFSPGSSVPSPAVSNFSVTCEAKGRQVELQLPKGVVTEQQAAAEVSGEW